jgi:hypothetical protein
MSSRQHPERAPTSLDAFTDAYIEAALWSSTDNAGDDDSGGEPLDKNYGPSDIAPATMSAMHADCASFVERYGHLIADDDSPAIRKSGSWVLAGYDFWLNRNETGAGFWDGDWPKHGDELDKAAESYGRLDLYVGDDGKIYAGGYETDGVANEATMNSRNTNIRSNARRLGPPEVTEHRDARTGRFAPGDAPPPYHHRHRRHGAPHRRTQAAPHRGSVAPRVRDYDVTNNHGKRIAGPFKDYGDARTEAERMGGVVGFVAGEGYGHAVGCPMHESSRHGHSRAPEAIRVPDPAGGWAVIQRMMKVYARQKGLGDYVHNSALPTGEKGVWSFRAQRPGERKTEYRVTNQDLKAAYEREGLSESGATGQYAEANRRRAGYPGSKRRPRNVPVPRRTPNQSDARQHGTVTVTSTERPDLNGTWSFLVRPYAAGDGWEWIALQNGDQAKGGGARTKAEATKGGSEYIRHIQSIARGKGWRTRRRGQAGPVTMEHENGGSYRAEANRNSPRGGATRRISDRAPQMTKAAVLSIATQLADKVRGTTPKYVGAHRWSDRNESATFVTHTPEHAQPVVVLVSVFADGTLALDFFSSEERSGTDRYENIGHFLYSTVDYGEMKADIKWVWETVDSYAESWGAGHDEVDERHGVAEHARGSTPGRRRPSRRSPASRAPRRHPHSVLSRQGAKRIAAEASGQRRRLREGPDAEAAGERYAEDQVNSDGFRDWVWDQMFEGRRMRKADPKSVIPLDNAADYKKLARNMLQQLGWDIDRDMTMRDVLDAVGVDDQGSAANSEIARDFAKGVRNLLHKPNVVQWLATEARGFEKELKQAEKGRKAGEPAQTTRLLPPAPQHR